MVRGAILIASAIILEREGTSHHPAFIVNFPTTSNMFLVLCTQQMSFP